jgi:predicted transcriptional regulator
MGRDPTYTVRLPEDLIQAVDRFAEAEELSRSEVIRVPVADYLKRKRLAMPHRITGLAHSAGGEMATSAETAKKALEIARQWAAQGVTNIIITNPEGESYDLDRFGMIASTKEEGHGGL